MDPQIEELKELVRQNIALSKDTNKIVHGMRRAARLKSIFWFIVFLGSIGVSAAGIYLYVLPNVGQIQHFISNAQATIQSAQDTLKTFQSVGR